MPWRRACDIALVPLPKITTVLNAERRIVLPLQSLKSLQSESRPSRSPAAVANRPHKCPHCANQFSCRHDSPGRGRPNLLSVRKTPAIHCSASGPVAKVETFSQDLGNESDACNPPPTNDSSTKTPPCAVATRQARLSPNPRPRPAARPE